MVISTLAISCINGVMVVGGGGGVCVCAVGACDAEADNRAAGVASSVSVAAL